MTWCVCVCVFFVLCLVSTITGDMPWDSGAGVVYCWSVLSSRWIQQLTTNMGESENPHAIREKQFCQNWRVVRRLPDPVRRTCFLRQHREQTGLPHSTVSAFVKRLTRGIAFSCPWTSGWPLSAAYMMWCSFTRTEVCALQLLPSVHTYIMGLLLKVWGLKREDRFVNNFTLYPELVSYGSVSFFLYCCVFVVTTFFWCVAIMHLYVEFL
jgi:hypothetical protein